MHKSMEVADNKINFSEEQEIFNEYFKSMLEDSKSTGIMNALDFSLEVKTELPKEIILKENYKKQCECQICFKKFNILLKKKRHCKFCGNCICDSHGKRRHIDPKDCQKFYRCCDLCHFKFIKATIEEDFEEKLNAKEVELNKKREDLLKHEQKLLWKQKKLAMMYQQVNILSNQFNTFQFEDDKLQYEKKCEMIGEETEQFEKQDQEKLDKINEMKKEKIEIEKQIQLLGEQTEQLTNDLPILQKSNQQQQEKSLLLSKELLQKQKEVIVVKKFLKEVEKLQQVQKLQVENQQLSDNKQNESLNNESSEEDEQISIMQQRIYKESIQNEPINILDISKQFENPKSQQKMSENQDQNIKDINSCKICVTF